MDEQLIMLLGLALFLLIANRYFQTQRCNHNDGFDDVILVNGTTSLLGRRCGVDVGGCPDDLRCANGMCISQKMPNLCEKHPLPVLP